MSSISSLFFFSSCGPTTIASHGEAAAYLVNPVPTSHRADPSSYDLYLERASSPLLA